MKTLRCTLLALLSLLLAATASAQMKLEVEAPTEVDINEPYFQVRFSIASASASGFTAPDFKGFEVLAGPSVSVSQSHISRGGRSSSSSSTTYTFTLAPEQRGTLRIGTASVVVGGRLYKSAPATIRVTASGKRQAQPGVGADPIQAAGSAVTERDLYVKSTLARPEVYEGEGVLLTYKFYLRPGVGLSTVSLSQKPDFQGVVSQDVPTSGIMEDVERVGGQTFRTGVMQQYVLYPQQTGALHIPSLTFDFTVRQRDVSIDPIDAFFNGTGEVARTLKREAPEAELRVLPLPAPRPTTFGGGVGQFSIQASLLSPRLRTGDMATYRITMRGTGNLKLIAPPALTFPSDFDVYAPRTTDSTQVSTAGVTGAIHFDYNFVPRSVGHYELPAMKWTYFDPTTGEYRSIELPAAQLHVEQGTAAAAGSGDLPESDFRPIHPGNHRLATEEELAWWGTWRYWLTLLLLAGGGVALHYLLLALERRRHTTADAYATLRRQLRTAQAALGAADVPRCVAVLDDAIGQYLTAVLPPGSSTRSKAQCLDELARRGVDEQLRARLASLIEECAAARFAPIAPTQQEAERLLGQVQSASQQLSQQMKRKSKRSVKPHLIVLLITTSWLTAWPASASLSSADSAYQAGAYKQAAALYEAALTEGVNADVYYNLGCAHFRANQYAEAVINFERALRLEPSHRDAAANLAIVRSRLEDKLETPSTMFFITALRSLVYGYSAAQWGLAAACALVLAVLGALLARHSRGRWPQRVGLTLVVTMALCFVGTTASAWLARERFADEHRVVVVDTAPLTGERGETIVTLHQGTSLRLLWRAADGSVQVELPDGRRGWLQASSVEVVY